MSRKVIVREGVNVRTLEYGSGSGDRMDLFIDEGETLLSGMASAHSCTVILTDASSGQDYIFAIWDKLAIGRCAPASGEDVRMVIYWDHQVSHLHAILYYRNQRLFIRDNESSNHTYVNDKVIKQDTYLYQGDRIRLGKTALVIRYMNQ